MLSNILKDVEQIYRIALKKENLTVALRAKELLGRERGLFVRSFQKNKVALENLSEADLHRLIAEINVQLEIRKNQTPPVPSVSLE